MKLSNASGSRKTLAMFRVICIMLACFSGVLPVKANGSTMLTASEVKTEKGNTVEVAFHLEENAGIWGLKFKVGYDHSVLTLTSVKNGSIFSDEEITLPESLDKEQFVFLACSNQTKNINKNGTVAILKFTVAKDAELKSYPITVSVTQAINASGKDIGVKTKEGSVDVIRLVYSGEESNGIANADDERKDIEKEIEKDTEKDMKSQESVKEEKTSGSQTEKSKSKTGIMVIILVVIAVVCGTCAFLSLMIKRRRKKQCKRKRRSEK